MKRNEMKRNKYNNSNSSNNCNHINFLEILLNIYSINQQYIDKFD